MAHPKVGDEWLVKRVCRYIKGRPRYAQSCEVRPRSWWCRQKVIGHRAGPLDDPIQEAGCFEVAIFFIIGAGFKPVPLSVLVKLSCMRKSKVCKGC